MSLNRFWLLVPSRRTLLTIALSTLFGVAVTIVASAWLTAPRSPAPNPKHSHNAKFVALGQAFLPHLGKAYADAWDEGAKRLEAGHSVSAALEAVSSKWSSNRTQLYDRMLTPEFSAILRESVRDSDVTPKERSALAAAWRGLSLGLGQ